MLPLLDELSRPGGCAGCAGWPDGRQVEDAKERMTRLFAHGWITGSGVGFVGSGPPRPPRGETIGFRVTVELALNFWPRS